MCFFKMRSHYIDQADLNSWAQAILLQPHTAYLALTGTHLFYLHLMNIFNSQYKTYIDIGCFFFTWGFFDWSWLCQVRLPRQQGWWRQRHRNPFGQAHTIGVFCCRKTAHRRVTAVTGGQGRRLWTKVTTWSGEMASRLHHPQQVDETLTPKSYLCS